LNRLLAGQQTEINELLTQKGFLISRVSHESVKRKLGGTFLATLLDLKNTSTPPPQRVPGAATAGVQAALVRAPAARKRLPVSRENFFRNKVV
jgi:hypothetical protein